MGARRGRWGYHVFVDRFIKLKVNSMSVSV